MLRSRLAYTQSTFLQRPHHGLDADNLAAVAEARRPETRLGYALQLCALRYPYEGPAPGRDIDRGSTHPQFSPLAWDHINLTGDYVWSDALALDADGYMPLKLPAA